MGYDGPDRRTDGPRGRRSEDLVGWRLGGLENDVEKLEVAVSPHKLDERYPPRAEVARDYVSKTDLRQERATGRDSAWKLVGAVLAAVNLLEAYLLARGR